MIIIKYHQWLPQQFFSINDDVLFSRYKQVTKNADIYWSWSFEHNEKLNEMERFLFKITYRYSRTNKKY